VNAANEDPDGNSVAFDLPLRQPGQYFDKETALHYNYFRDYDPSIGRYAESDPIGLRGGLNSYGYARASPLEFFDWDGKEPGSVGVNLGVRLGFGIQPSPPLPRPENAEIQNPALEPQPFVPPQDWTKYCVTAECAAGLPPAKPDSRTQREIDVSMCRQACRISGLACQPFARVGGRLVTVACAAAVQACIRQCESPACMP